MGSRSAASLAAALGAALLCLLAVCGCSPSPQPGPTLTSASRCDGTNAKVSWDRPKAALPVAVRVLVTDPTAGTSASASIPLQASANIQFRPGPQHSAPESENDAQWSSVLVSKLRGTGIVPKDFGTTLTLTDTTTSVSATNSSKTMIVEEISTVSVPFRVACPGGGGFSGFVRGPVSDGTLFTDTVLCDAQPGPGDAPDVVVAVGLTDQFCVNP